MIHLRIGMETMIGARIAKEMKFRDWSEGELARRSGVNQPTIHRIITGESKNPRRDNVERVAKALGVSVEWLWSGNPRLAPSLAAEEALSSQGDSAAQPLESQEPEYPRMPHEVAARAASIAALASPRSQEILARIAKAAEDGRLTESDLDLLDRIVSRLESSVGVDDNNAHPANGNQRLKERLRNNDPGTQR